MNDFISTLMALRINASMQERRDAQLKAAQEPPLPEPPVHPLEKNMVTAAVFFVFVMILISVMGH